MFYRRADSVWWSVICGGGYTKVANFSGWLFLKNLTNLNCEVKLCIKKSIIENGSIIIDEIMHDTWL